ncbi:MAG: amino acid-binding protein, partial [Deltaproteobacteria bacterium]|nr:amino acid-binding protein [Deltaproteobacteria bacterium]
LFENGINVEYMYAFVQQSGQNAVIIFRFDDIDNAVDVLMQNGVTVIGGEKLYAM